MSLARLLFAASLIERHQLHRSRVAKIRHRRIVKRNMPVLAEADESHIDRSIKEEFGIARHFSIQIGGVARQIMRLQRMHLLFETGANP